MTQLAEAPAREHSPEPTVWGSWFRRHPVLTFLLVIFFLTASTSIHRDIVEARQMQPLRVIEQALDSSGQQLGTITPGLNERWTNGYDPTEKQVRMRWSETNRYLEPVFFSPRGEQSHRSYRPDPGDRCYFIAVQAGGGDFRANAVQGITRFCFRGTFPTPHSSASVSVTP